MLGCSCKHLFLYCERRTLFTRISSSCTEDDIIFLSWDTLSLIRNTHTPHTHTHTPTQKQLIASALHHESMESDGGRGNEKVGYLFVSKAISSSCFGLSVLCHFPSPSHFSHHFLFVHFWHFMKDGRFSVHFCSNQRPKSGPNPSCYGYHTTHQTLWHTHRTPTAALRACGFVDHLQSQMHILIQSSTCFVVGFCTISD